jgi:hypothetical protein
MNKDNQNTEYELLHVQPWEIEGCEDLTEDSYEASMSHDQQVDLFCGYNN